jgi:hypothetical protein
VNVAARLEGIAEPGGIYISDAAYHQVQDKIPVEFADVGEQNLKNIARPVRAYAVRDAEPRTSPDVTIRAANVPKLSLVVLPFANLGGGADQDYFVDGLTEDLTTELSRLSSTHKLAPIPATDVATNKKCDGAGANLGDRIHVYKRRSKTS